MSAYWPPYAVEFRGLPACPCQVQWIPEFERRLRLVVPSFQGTVALAQLIGTFGGSGGTHGDPSGIGLRKGGGASDLWLTGGLADQAVKVARDMGADPTWRRRAGWDGPGSDEHVHSTLRGCPHRTTSALVQEACVDRNDDGLVGDAPDSGPRPLSHRTWQDGIKWAREQEDEVTEDDIKALAHQILDVETVDLRKADGSTKPITVRKALQRILNPDAE